jgi:hypothetical protein
VCFDLVADHDDGAQARRIGSHCSETADELLVDDGDAAAQWVNR